MPVSVSVVEQQLDHESVCVAIKSVTEMLPWPRDLRKESAQEIAKVAKRRNRRNLFLKVEPVCVAIIGDENAPVTAGSSKRIGTGDRKDRKATEPGNTKS